MQKHVQKAEADVTRQILQIRAEMDPRDMKAIEALADEDGRSLQRQIGIMLENCVRIAREPAGTKFEASDLLNPPKKLAAVA